MTESDHHVVPQDGYSFEMPPSYFTREIHNGVNTIDLQERVIKVQAYRHTVHVVEGGGPGSPPN